MATSKENENIGEESAASEVRNSMSEYAMDVVEDRALPSVIDGLKPVHRRLLFSALADLNLKPSAKTQKSAKLIGAVLGNFHPHGDQAAYGGLVTLTSRFASRYPLFSDEQGNWGDKAFGDGAAAMRYTEVVSSEIGAMYAADMNHLDYVRNYDNTRDEPFIFCPPIPTVLLNGSSGIAVGCASEIPDHSITGVCDATLAILKNPNCRDSTLLEAIGGPDHVNGGVLLSPEDGWDNTQALQNLYLNGGATLYFRPQWHLEESDREEWKHKIVVTSLCPGMSGVGLINGNIFGDLVQNGDIQVLDMSSGSTNVSVHVYYNNTALAVNSILPSLVGFGESYSLNVLDYEGKTEDGRLSEKLAVRVNLRYIITRWLAHRREVVQRRIQAKIDELTWEHEKLLVQKYLAEHPKEREQMINSATDEELQRILTKVMKFNERQAAYAPTIQIRTIMRLNADDLDKAIAKILEGLKEQQAQADDIDGVITKEVRDIKNRFGDDRRLLLSEKAEYPKVVETSYLVAVDKSFGVVSHESWPDKGRGLGNTVSADFCLGKCTLIGYYGKAQTILPFNASSCGLDEYYAGVASFDSSVIACLNDKGELYLRWVPDDGFEKKTQIARGDEIVCAVGIRDGDDLLIRLSDGTAQYLTWDNISDNASEKLGKPLSYDWGDGCKAVSLTRLSGNHGQLVNSKGDEVLVADYSDIDGIIKSKDGTIFALDDLNLVTFQSGRVAIMPVDEVLKTIGTVAATTPVYGGFGE